MGIFGGRIREELERVYLDGGGELELNADLASLIQEAFARPRSRNDDGAV